MLAVPAFRRLWIALSLSSLGDWLGFIATTTLAREFETGYSSGLYAIAGVLAVRLAPALFIGPFGGAWADRFNRRYTMVVSDLARFGLYASIPLVHTLTWLLIATFLVEALSLFWIPCKDASVPDLVPSDQLESANQLSLIATYGSAAVASSLFAVLSELDHGLVAAAGIHTDPVDLALYLDAATFLIAAIAVFSLRQIGRPRAHDGDDGSEQPGTWRSIAEGFRYIGSERWLRGLVVGILGAVVAAAAVIGLVSQFVIELHAGDAGYGVLFTTVFVGLASGMLLGPRLLTGFPRRRLMGPAICGAGVALAFDAIMPNLLLAMVFTFLMGAFAGVTWVVAITLVGLEVPDAMRGRTFAFVYNMMRLTLLAAVVVAPAMAGLIGDHGVHFGDTRLRLDGVTLTLLVAGLLAAVVGVVCLRLMDDRRDVPLLVDLGAVLRRRPPRTGRGTTQGLLVVFEGGEGAGKTSQTRWLAAALQEQGYEVVLTAEPGGTTLGERLRGLLLERGAVPPVPVAEAFLYAADRAQHVAAVIRPAMARGAVVLSDRYVDSSLAYQGGGRELSRGEVRRLSTWATEGLLADLTVLLDVDPEVGLGRTTGPGDRLEDEAMEFHRRVRATFLDLARAGRSRYLVLDATGDEQLLHAEILSRLTPLLPEPAAAAAVEAPRPLADVES